jgi:tape measure domain-containing protein
MATDIERLVVRLEAQTRSFEREMQKVRQQADQAAKGVEDRFGRMETRLAGVGRGAAEALLASLRQIGPGVGAAIAGYFSVQAIQDYATEHRDLQRQLVSTNLTSTQTGDTFQRLMRIAQETGQPIRQVTENFVAMSRAEYDLETGAAVSIAATQGLATAMRAVGATTQQATEVATAFNGAVTADAVSMEQFNSMLVNGRPVLQAVADGLIDAGGSLETLRNKIYDGEVSGAAFFRAFLAGMNGIRDSVPQGAETVENALNRVNNSMVGLIGELDRLTGASAIYSSAMSGVADAADTAAGRVAYLADGVARLNRLMEQLSGFNLSNLGGLANLIQLAGNVALRSMGVAPGEGTSRPLVTIGASGPSGPPAVGMGDWESDPIGRNDRWGSVRTRDYPVSSGGGGGGGGGNEDRESAFDKAIRQQERQLAVTRAEVEAVGLAEGSRQRLILTRRLEQIAVEANTAAGLENTAVTEEQRRRIDELAAATERASQRLAEATQRQQQAIELQRGIGQELVTSIGALVRSGQSFSQVVGNMAGRLSDLALQATLLGTGPLAGLFGTAAAAGTKNVGGLVGLAASFFGGARAEGGPITANRAYLVGERGPELVVPRNSGYVVPNTALARSGSNGGGAMALTVDVRGANGDVEIQRRVEAGVAAGIAQYDRQLGRTLHVRMGMAGARYA